MTLAQERTAASLRRPRGIFATLRLVRAVLAITVAFVVPAPLTLAQEGRAPADAPQPAGAWQLFLDDHWVAQASGLMRTLHQPTKHPDNPIIRGESPWAANPYCYGTVMYDEEEAIYKLWYMSYNFGRPVAERTPILYSTSVDGVSWEHPELGLHAFQGSTANNIVLYNYGHHDLYSPGVIKDPADPDSKRRYKMIWWDFPLGPTGYQDDGMCVAFSPDGIRWTRYSENPVLHAFRKEESISDVVAVHRDARRGKYVVYSKGWADPWPAFRQIVRSESTDFVHWSKPEVVLRHAHDVQDPQSYGMFVAPYESVYIGLLPSYKKPGDETIDLQLTLSHDNRRWSRVAEQATFLPLGPDGSWDDGMIFAAPPIVRGDRIEIYYGGWDGAHDARKRRAAIGLATLRRDGFVSLDASAAGGSLTTHILRGAAGSLFVNAAASAGSLAIEVLDVAGQPLAGYTTADCLPLRGDGIAQLVRWGRQDRLPGAEFLRLRFTLREASLYSFSAGPGVERAREGLPEPATPKVSK